MATEFSGVQNLQQIKNDGTPVKSRRSGKREAGDLMPFASIIESVQYTKNQSLGGLSPKGSSKTDRGQGVFLQGDAFCQGGTSSKGKKTGTPYKVKSEAEKNYQTGMSKGKGKDQGYVGALGSAEAEKLHRAGRAVSDGAREDHIDAILTSTGAEKTEVKRSKLSQLQRAAIHGELSLPGGAETVLSGQKSVGRSSASELSGKRMARHLSAPSSVEGPRELNAVGAKSVQRAAIHGEFSLPGGAETVLSGQKSVGRSSASELSGKRMARHLSAPSSVEGPRELNAVGVKSVQRAAINGEFSLPGEAEAVLSGQKPVGRSSASELSGKRMARHLSAPSSVEGPRELNAVGAKSVQRAAIHGEFSLPGEAETVLSGQKSVGRSSASELSGKRMARHLSAPSSVEGPRELNAVGAKSVQRAAIHGEFSLPGEAEAVLSGQKPVGRSSASELEVYEKGASGRGLFPREGKGGIDVVSSRISQKGDSSRSDGKEGQPLQSQKVAIKGDSPLPEKADLYGAGKAGGEVQDRISSVNAAADEKGTHIVSVAERRSNGEDSKKLSMQGNDGSDPSKSILKQTIAAEDLERSSRPRDGFSRNSEFSDSGRRTESLYGTTKANTVDARELKGKGSAEKDLQSGAKGSRGDIAQHASKGKDGGADSYEKPAGIDLRDSEAARSKEPLQHEPISDRGIRPPGFQHTLLQAGERFSAVAENVDITPRAVIDQIADGARMSGGRVRIALSPPSLGNLDMDVIVRDNKVHLVLQVENSDVKQMLQSNMESLKGSLRAQGLVADSIEVFAQDRIDADPYSSGRNSDMFSGGGNSRSGSGQAWGSREGQFPPDQEFPFAEEQAKNVASEGRISLFA